MLNFPQIEEKILVFWKKNKIFEKSLKKTKKGKRFVFFEGPPFANGLPGIHHLLSRAFKDIILRYKTMRGFFVERKAGWDTHGLPTEVEAEKKLGVKTKKDIEKIGIEKFIRQCQDSVFIYKKEWEDFTERIGFWLDLKNAYITCSSDYIETLWWILKQAWDKKLLYQGYRVVPFCPRCETSLSSHEVAQGYRNIKEPSIYVKFRVKSKNPEWKNTSILTWTTTPWTLPGNVALAVNPKMKYICIPDYDQPDHWLVLGFENFKRLLSKGIFPEKYQRRFKAKPSQWKGKDVDVFMGSEMIGIEYEPLYNFQKDAKNAFKVIAGDFVSTEEGTGIVHIAPAFGEEDMEVGQQNNLPVLMTVNEDGTFKKEIKPWAGKFVKDADPLIIEDLKKRGLLYKEELYEHDYPFCWRCNSPLLYYAKTSWFIKMSALQARLLANNKRINWIPEYLKEGRFGEWLKEVKDWNLSRERFWGTPLPVWLCQTGKSKIQMTNIKSNPKPKVQKGCENIKVVGSIKELEELSGKRIKDLHRPYIDEITFKCEKCGGEMKRIPEVADCWFDSGSMPYAQWYYPFVNKEKIDQGTFFPADFICEGIDQTRGWFYTLLAVSTLLNLGPAYKNVISHGIVLDVKGQKMSKSKGNVVWPKDVIDKFGADCARFYFYTINPVAEPKRFDFKDVQDLSRRVFDTLWNSYIFFATYADKSFKPKKDFQSRNLLDIWIVSRLHTLCQKVIENLDKYYIVEAARLFDDFVDNLSNWYIRRSRRRFQKPANIREKEEAQQTLYCVLLNLAKLLAPFAPFISEEIYRQLGQEEESVHLCNYPQPKRSLIDERLEQQMEQVRQVIGLGLAVRAKSGIKIRQPLSNFQFSIFHFQLDRKVLDLMKEELNVRKVGQIKRMPGGKNWVSESEGGIKAALNTKITPILKEEGLVRDLIRQIQEMRRQAGLRPQDKIGIVFKTKSTKLKAIIKKYYSVIKKETSAKKITDLPAGRHWGEPRLLAGGLLEKEIDLDIQVLRVGIRKI